MSMRSPVAVAPEVPAAPVATDEGVGGTRGGWFVRITILVVVAPVADPDRSACSSRRSATRTSSTPPAGGRCSATRGDERVDARELPRTSSTPRASGTPSSTASPSPCRPR